MTRKLTFEELQALVLDPSQDINKLRKYFVSNPEDSKPFAPKVLLNPTLVNLTDEQAELENAMDWANGWSRGRRNRRFERRLKNNDPRPIIVTEGDSWCQFPLLIDDVVDHLFHKFTIKSFGAAGATAAEMVAKAEYVPALRSLRSRIKAFFFSGAGNDVIGEDAAGVPNIEKLVVKYSGQTNPEDLIDKAALSATLSDLRSHYDKMLSQVRIDAGLSSLPVIVHGYDYAIPGTENDDRDPIWATPNQWLGRPLSRKGITDRAMQREIIKFLINSLYDELNRFAASDPHVHVVNVRGTLPDVTDWADEIHGTGEGFKRVAKLVENKIRSTSGANPEFETSNAGLGGSESAVRSEPATVVIDPGHGGNSRVGGSSPNNATGPNGTKEKDLTLKVGERLRDVLRARGVRVLMTRASDRNLGLSARARVAHDHDADVFLSIHFNGWETPNVQGTETFHHTNASTLSQALAQRVQTSLLEATKLRDRGVKRGAYGVLRPSRHRPKTSACLTEISFLTDPAEEQRLLDDAYINAIAISLADGVENYLDHSEGANIPDIGIDFETATLEEREDGFGLAPGLTEDQDTTENSTNQPALDWAPPEPIGKPSDMSVAMSIGGIKDAEQFLKKFRAVRQEEVGSGPTLEATIGEKDDSLPVSFLSEGARLGKAVCKVEVSDSFNYKGGFGSWSGSGFLVGPDLLLTNHHVINDIKAANNARVRFDYQIRADGTVSYGEYYDLDPDSLFIFSPAIDGLDYAFVRVTGRPGDVYGYVDLQRASFTIAEGERANIIHHPNGSPKRVSLQENNSDGMTQALLWYMTDTQSGSSGSPVFDNTWRLIALHHAAKTFNDPSGETKIRNEGIKISAIAVDLDMRVNDPEVGSAARTVLSAIKGSDSLTGYFGAAGRRAEGTDGLETVINAYAGGPQDVDIGFWNVEWFNRRFKERVHDVATIVADLNLDIWSFAETSPESIQALAEYLNDEFGHEFKFAASEPQASSGRQTTSVMWNPATVEGKRMEWPDEIERLLKADSRDDLGLEAVDGKIFNRYPAWFRFKVLGRDEQECAGFDFNLVPLHLKAMAEGAKRRRLASKVLVKAINSMIKKHEADHDWVLIGDINAPLATGEFDALTRAGFSAIGAKDEDDGAFTYLKRPKSLIDNIFLSPSLSKTYGSNDFLIYAGDQNIPGYVKSISDHRIIMARLALHDCEAPDNGLPADTLVNILEPSDNYGADTSDFWDELFLKLNDDPKKLLKEILFELTKRVDG